MAKAWEAKQAHVFLLGAGIFSQCWPPSLYPLPRLLISSSSPSPESLWVPKQAGASASIFAFCQSGWFPHILQDWGQVSLLQGHSHPFSAVMKSSYPVLGAKKEPNEEHGLPSGRNQTAPFPFHPLKQCQRMPAKAEDLNKIQSLIISTVSRLHLKITHHTKN